MALISVIVPVYKVEAYLHRCVDSVLKQTYRELELILVDDGSPDGCPGICDAYEAADNRVRVVHKANGGLSDARNAGMRIAQGEYIAFVDSDDWVAQDYLETMLEALRRSGSDICECGVQKAYDYPAPEDCGIQEEMTVYDTVEALRRLILDRELKQHVWNKLYKCACLYDIPFAVGKTNEDEFWTYQVFGKAERVVKMDRVLYYYFQRPGSIMSSGYSIRRLDALEAKQARQEYIESRYPELAQTAKGNLFQSCMYAGQMSLKFLLGEEKKEAVRRVDQYRKTCNLDSISLKAFSGSMRIWATLGRISFWGTCRVRNLLNKGF